MLARIKAKREERAKLVADVRAILDKTDPTPEEYGKATELLDREDALKKEIDTLERALDAEARADELADARAGRENVSRDEAADRTRIEAETFEAFIRGGMLELAPDQRKIMAGLRRQLPQGALTTGTGSSGGYTVPEGFRQNLEDAILSFGGMRAAATIWTTDSGETIPWPTANDTAQVGAIVGENVDAFTGGTDPSFDQVPFGAFIYTSRGVLVPVSLLQDSAFDIPGKLATWLGLRIARAQNAHFTTGVGTTQPTGVVTSATEGWETAAGQTASLIYDDLVELQHSVDPFYRRSASFMMADSTLKAIKMLKDATSELPAWVPGIALREPDTILGHPYVINDDVDALGAGNAPLVFGDIKKYVIRDVRAVQMVRFDEKYMDALQVGFMSFHRADGNLVDAGTHPVKYLSNAAT